MRKTYFLNSYLILFILFISAGLFSCSSTQKVKYFQDIPDSGKVQLIPAIAYKAPKVQIGDLLSVMVQTIDPTATQIITSSSSLPGAAAVQPSASLLTGVNLPQPSNSGLLVDSDGQIELPILGKIKVAGYTTAELRDSISVLANKYYNHAVVTVKLSNFTVNVIGEVLKPGFYIMPTEKVTIINAIAMAGDLTIFGKRENVLLLRENPDGTKRAYRINLKKTDVLSSDLYYLRQNDVVYVEPRKAKSDATDASQAKYITIASGVLSLLIILAYRAK